MTSSTETGKPLFLTYLDIADADQRIVGTHPEEGETRTEGCSSDGVSWHIVTRAPARSTLGDRRVGAVSVGLSVAQPQPDRAAASVEIDRSLDDAVWSRATVLIDGQDCLAQSIRLLAGTWAAHIEHQGLGILIGIQGRPIEGLQLTISVR